MFTKQGYSVTEIQPLQKEAVLADPVILERMTKLAKDIKRIAPKSDDFLYFSIIFMKAAESSLIDEKGEIKKIGKENAWGYFDDNWRWHGNVRPHKNNNGDLFSEKELRKYSKDWIGKPLCKDHKSDSVDGIRGIILDTHYDEKLKQVVGLCALDKVNYPDLAKKVETGIVRYGSMGTAVEMSVCTDCGNIAKVASDYCKHVKDRTAYGEINVGLKPIEYSLVVQPAEPGAILLKCIASLQNYRDEFIRYGYEDYKDIIGSLTFDQAQHLKTIMDGACGEDGCNIDERRKIVSSFIDNQIIKKAQLISPDANFGKQTGLEVQNEEGTKDFSGISGSVSASVSEPNEFNSGGVIPEQDPVLKQANNPLRSILEDIVKGISKKSYFQGADGKSAEPSGTYKKESFDPNKDKHMQQDGKMGGDKGSFPGDEQIKSKQKRADLEARRLRRNAYFQGADGKSPEPSGTYKKESFDFNKDKHMQQDGKMGGNKGTFPGDEQIKSKQKRAGYNGPELSTKLKIPVDADGNVTNKLASVFEVYAGDKKIIAASAHEIFGDIIEKQASRDNRNMGMSNWDYLRSKQYGKDVCASIRELGVKQVSEILKGAQMAPTEPVMPPAAPPDMGGAPGEMAAPMAPAADMGAAPSPAADMNAPQDPKAELESALVSIETAVSDARSASEQLGGGDVNINVDADKGVSENGEEIKLSRQIRTSLKEVIANLEDTANDLAMLSETYENISSLPAEKVARVKALAKSTIEKAKILVASTAPTIKIAQNFSKTIKKVAEIDYAEDYSNMVSDKMEDDASDKMEDEVADQPMSDKAEDEVSEDDVQDLISQATELRRLRREGFIALAAKKKAKKPAKKKAKKPAKKEEKEEPKAEVEMKEEKKEEKKEASKVSSTTKTASALSQKVNKAFENKKQESGQIDMKIKIRRAYDVALEMQKKGMIAGTQTALNKQVDDILEFDDKAFESFKRTVAASRTPDISKTASEIVNVGLNDQESPSTPNFRSALKKLW